MAALLGVGAGLLGNQGDADWPRPKGDDLGTCTRQSAGAHMAASGTQGITALQLTRRTRRKKQTQDRINALFPVTSCGALAWARNNKACSHGAVSQYLCFKCMQAEDE